MAFGGDRLFSAKTALLPLQLSSHWFSRKVCFGAKAALIIKPKKQLVDYLVNDTVGRLPSE